jgi:general secretion pathway protein D
MHIRPTLTDTEGDGPNDPAVDILRTSVLVNTPSTISGETLTTVNNILSTLKSTVPNIRVRELDTVLKAKSGEVMVIGGLIQHTDKTAENGFPFLDEIPLLGRLAKVTEHASKVVETVILIQPTIVQGHYYHNHDKKFYETFAQDPRPLVFN